MSAAARQALTGRLIANQLRSAERSCSTEEIHGRRFADAALQYGRYHPLNVVDQPEQAMDFGQLALYAALVAGLCVIMLGLSSVLGQRTRLSKSGAEAYESGIISTGGARYRMSAKFYLVAVFFVIFDLEAVYVLAWGVAAREAGWAGYIEIMVFLTLLLVALVYLWRTGALDWAPKAQKASDRHY